MIPSKKINVSQLMAWYASVSGTAPTSTIATAPQKAAAVRSRWLPRPLSTAIKM